ncbi:hypothetical protein M9Y10_026229 [Tritrichomonas musculus]|uniref:Uncharacterized protein n=1 Tax=Tritrichomonas musculus TaxID=1915356 RepID=A0ABR2H728_9EUKA
MQAKKRKEYNSHKIGFGGGVIEEYHNYPSLKDRVYMFDQFKPHLDYLIKNNIKEFQDFIQFFRNKGLKAKDFVKMIKSFQKYINTKHQDQFHPIYFLKPRELEKSNFGEKNIIINRIAHEYFEDFPIFLQHFLHKKYQTIPNHENIIQDVKDKIKKLRSNIDESLDFDFSITHFSMPEDDFLSFSEGLEDTI